METIYALASGQGRAGVSVIRVSGPGAKPVVAGLCGHLPTARHAALRTLRTASGDVLDQAVILVFDAPRSFTGEDVVELQVHGSMAVVRDIQNALSETGVARLAENGEFTRRALENGRLDLSQVEGLADLIDAETQAQRKQAQRVLSGGLGDQVGRWRKDLIRAAALLEATIDFADEDVPVDVSPEVRSLLNGVTSDLKEQIAGSFAAERIRDGYEVALVGPPNSGKSTLLNRLAGREAAITSDIAGTTRDVIEVRLDLQGLPVTFLDTAGLRESDDTVETIGVARAVDRAQKADVRVFLGVGDTVGVLKPLKDDICLRPKLDVPDGGGPGISGKTGTGVQELLDMLADRLSTEAATAGVAIRERHRRAMTTAQQQLLEVQQLLKHGPDRYDIAAEELRSAIRALETLLGHVDVEALLDEIFASFCLGK